MSLYLLHRQLNCNITFSFFIHHNFALRIYLFYIVSLLISGDPNTKPWLASYAGWRENGDPCFGRWVRNICVFGIGDILYLTEKKHLFANKFYIDQQPLALDCLEEWLLSKTCRPVTLDLDYYRNLPFVNKWSVQLPTFTGR